MNYRDTTNSVELVKEGSEYGSISVCVHDYVSRLPVDSIVKLYRVDENGDTLVGEYQTGSIVGQLVGCTVPITVLPGYYTVSVEGGRNHFLKAVIVAPGKNTSVDVNYFDLDVNKEEITDIFNFETIEYKEGTIAQEMNIGSALIDHYTDEDGNRIAYTGIWPTQFGSTLNVYCYERTNQIFSIRHRLSASQYELLNAIVEEEAKSPGYYGKFYSLEIKCTSGQDEYEHTFAVTANDILDHCIEDNGNYYFEFAKIIYDNLIETYRVETIF